MKFRYIGAGDDPPDAVVTYGYTFVRGGAPVEVSDPFHAGKLAGNRCFEAVPDYEPAPPPPPPLAEPAAEATEDDPPADPASTDAALYRAALEAEGVKVDGRWGLARLQAEYEAHCGGD